MDNRAFTPDDREGSLTPVEATNNARNTNDYTFNTSDLALHPNGTSPPGSGGSPPPGGNKQTQIIQHGATPDDVEDEKKNGYGNGIQNGFHKQNAIVDDSSELSDEQREALDEEQAKRDKDPIFYCRWITERPKTFFAIALGAQIFMVALVLILLAAGVDVVPFILDRVPLDIQSDADFLRAAAWDEKEEDTHLVTRFSIDEHLGGRTELMDQLNSYFYIKNGNVLTKENLKKIQEVETKLFNDEKYKESFCKRTRSGECEQPLSVIRYFDGSSRDIDPRFYDPDFNNVVGILNLANTHNDTKRQFQNYLGKNAVVSATEVTSDITRVSISIGWPLDGYTSTEDREEDQEEDVKKFCLDEWNPVLEDIYNDGVGDMEYYYTSFYLLTAVITRQVIYDQMLAGGSFLFIFIFMCLQTQSLWVTAWSMISILNGFATTILIYRFIFDFRYFGVFHVLAVFIVLGIGADNIFVFFDTWKEAGFQKYKSLAHRMSGAYRKAAMAMFFTSATTATAFIISATSPFLGIFSFGVFSGLLIVVNYLNVIIFVPTVIMTYHVYFSKFKCCCCCPKPLDEQEHLENGQPDAAPKVQQKRWIVRFFAGPFYTFITHKVARWIILVVLGGFVVFFAAYASNLEVDEEQINLFRDSSNFGRYRTLTNTAFKTNEVNVQVMVTWGLKEQDMSSCHYSDADCMGKTVWDDSFNMNSKQAQQDLLNFCENIRNLDADMVERLALAVNVVTGKAEVECFIDEMQEFYQNENSRQAVGGRDMYNPTLSFPLRESDVSQIVDVNSNVYDRSKLGVGYRHFDLGISYWLMNGLNLSATAVEEADHMTKYDTYLGEVEDPPHTHTAILGFPDLAGGADIPVTYTYGTRLKYMAIIANLTLSPNNLGYPTAGPIRDDWEEYVSAEVAKMSEGMQGGVMCTPMETIGFNAWHWLKTQKKLVESAIIGIVVGIGVAFPILVIATQNILVGTYATISIIFVTISVLGFIPLVGWKLGVMESLNLVLVVGLAVDYVVHLAEGYTRSHQLDRKGRARDMLEEVGVSVLSGAITTMGAAALLLIAQILFFFQFGLFIFSTILFSIVYALVLFTTFMALAGPQGSTGSMKPLYKKIASFFRRGKSGDISKA